MNEEFFKQINSLIKKIYMHVWTMYYEKWKMRKSILLFVYTNEI